ncbi:MAG: DNA repair protein RecO [Patescibacteria group bacterium]
MYYQDQAIVLNRKVFREDDLLITIYTQKYGKVVLQAVGAKKIKSKLAGHVEPMNLVEIEWVKGKILDKLTGAVVSSSFSDTKEDVIKVAYGMYFLEIIEQATENNHPDKKIFELLNNFLNKLPEIDNTDLPVLRILFIYKFLALAGFSPLFKKVENSNEFNLIKKIIYSPTDEFLRERVNSKDLSLIFKDSQIFLNEVLEKQLNSEIFLSNLSS